MRGCALCSSRVVPSALVTRASGSGPLCASRFAHRAALGFRAFRPSGSPRLASLRLLVLRFGVVCRVPGTCIRSCSMLRWRWSLFAPGAAPRRARARPWRARARRPGRGQAQGPLIACGMAAAPGPPFLPSRLGCPPPPPPPGGKFDFKMLKIIVLSTRGFAHGEGSSCCSGPCSSAQEPAARAFTHSMSRTNKTLYRSPHRALSLSLSRHFDQGAQMDRPNTVTTQYMLLFSQRSVALPSVELSQ